jgi:hypothetical protein
LRCVRARETLGMSCYRCCVLAKFEAHVSLLAPGRWLIGISLPLMGAWVAAAAMSKIDLFTGPFFWVIAYTLVVGIGLFVCGAVTAPTSPPTRKPRRSFSAVVLEEMALGVASFLVFWAFVAT